MTREGSALFRLTLLFLRFSRTGELARRLWNWKGLFVELTADPRERKDMRVLVNYLMKVGDEATRAALAEVLDSVIGTQRREEIMQSVGDKLIEQGHRRGLAEGLAEGVIRILRARGVRVGGKARQRILSCTDLATLDEWFMRALNASALSDVLTRTRPAKKRRTARVRAS